MGHISFFMWEQIHYNLGQIHGTAPKVTPGTGVWPYFENCHLGLLMDVLKDFAVELLIRSDLYLQVMHAIR